MSPGFSALSREAVTRRAQHACVYYNAETSLVQAQRLIEAEQPWTASVALQLALQWRAEMAISAPAANDRGNYAASIRGH